MRSQRRLNSVLIVVCATTLLAACTDQDATGPMGDWNFFPRSVIPPTALEGNRTGRMNTPWRGLSDQAFAEAVRQAEGRVIIGLNPDPARSA